MKVILKVTYQGITGIFPAEFDDEILQAEDYQSAIDRNTTLMEEDFIDNCILKVERLEELSSEQLQEYLKGLEVNRQIDKKRGK